MYPVLFEWKLIKIHSYGLLIVVGFLIGLYLVRKKAAKINIDVEEISDVAFWGLLGGFIGGRLLYIITRWGDFSQHPLDMLKFWEGGLVFYGGLIGGIVGWVLRAKKYKMPILKTVDLAAPSVAIAHVFGRFGCFAAGCCFGKPIDPNSPFAVIFNNPKSIAPIGVPLHPAQLYDAFNAFILFLILQLIYSKRKFVGQTVASYGLLYSIGRYVVEEYRGDKIRGFVIENLLSTSQFISLAIFIGSAYLYYHYWKRQVRRS